MPEPFKLFISHKGEDSDIADKIRQALYELINTKRRGKVLECFLSERITHGQDWLEELHNELHFATFLVLIFTDPDEDWSWCMYEAGYFSALRYLQERDPLRGHASSSRRRTFCLHHPELRPPSPLAHLQATRATEDRVKQMINTLLGDLGIPHSSERDEGLEDGDLVKGATTLAQINEAVARITQCFSLRDAVRHRTPSLRLVIKEGKDDSGRSKIEPLEELAKSLPPESYFSGTDEALRAIFQRSADRNLLPWTDAVETSQAASLGDGRPHYDTRWLVELVDIMYHASNHYYPQKPIHGLVFTGANNVIYSPVIRKISEHRTGTISCDIIFLKWEARNIPRHPSIYGICSSRCGWRRGSVMNSSRSLST